MPTTVRSPHPPRTRSPMRPNTVTRGARTQTAPTTSIGSMSTRPANGTSHSPPRFTTPNRSFSSRIRESIRVGRESILVGFGGINISGKQIPFDQQMETCRSAPGKDGAYRKSDKSIGTMVDLDFDTSWTSRNGGMETSINEHTSEDGSKDSGFFSWLFPTQQPQEEEEERPSVIPATISEENNHGIVSEFIQDRLDTFFGNIDFLLNGRRPREEDDIVRNQPTSGRLNMDLMSDESAELERKIRQYGEGLNTPAVHKTVREEHAVDEAGEDSTDENSTTDDDK